MRLCLVRRTPQPGSPVTGPFLLSSPNDGSPTRKQRCPCDECLPGPKITNWWPWSHGPAASQRFYCGWLSCEMTPVGHRFVMRRSKRLIMLFQCMKLVPRVGKTLPGSALPVIKLKRIQVRHTRQHQNGNRCLHPPGISMPKTPARCWRESHLKKGKHQTCGHYL